MKPRKASDEYREKTYVLVDTNEKQLKKATNALEVIESFLGELSDAQDGIGYKLKEHTYVSLAFGKPPSVHVSFYEDQWLIFELRDLFNDLLEDMTPYDEVYSADIWASLLEEYASKFREKAESKPKEKP